MDTILKNQSNHFLSDTEIPSGKLYAAEVSEKQTNQSFKICLNEKRYTAKLSPSCILIPELGDVVSVLFLNNQYYIVHILERNVLSRAQYQLKGSVKLGTEESSVEIKPYQVSIKTPAIKLQGDSVKIYAKAIEWLSDKLQSIHKSIAILADNQIVKIKKMLTVKTQNQQIEVKETDLKSSKIKIEKSDQVNISSNKFNINS